MSDVMLLVPVPQGDQGRHHSGHVTVPVDYRLFSIVQPYQTWLPGMSDTWDMKPSPFRRRSTRVTNAETRRKTVSQM